MDQATLVEAALAGRRITLSDLVGAHCLEGVDLNTSNSRYGRGADPPDSSDIVFMLDGITFQAEEDPDDGYRSFLGRLRVLDKPPTNRFAPVQVVAHVEDTDSANILHLTDSATGQIVLSVGTDNTDDYYPYCVMQWHPENLSCNQRSVT